MIQYEPLDRSHLAGVIRICQAEGWPSYTKDSETTWRALTAPGVYTVVALSGEDVVGFVQMQSDGLIQAHLSLIAVARPYRRMGIGHRLVEEAFGRCGGKRVDLLATGDAGDFYRSFACREFPGFRIYPGDTRA